MTGVQRRHLLEVRWQTEGIPLAGHLYLPTESGGDRVPAVVLTGPFTGTKDQVVGHYAALLAERGFACLAFDHRGFGESGGARQHEDPQGKLSDLRSAVSFLRSRPEIDADRIGMCGICLGGGYALKAAAFDPRVRAVAGVAGAYNDPIVFSDQLGSEAYRANLFELIERSRSELGDPPTIPAVSLKGPAGMPGEEPYEYYGTSRSRSRVWRNEVTMASLYNLMTLDTRSPATLLSQTPLLIVHGTVDAYCTPDGAKSAFDIVSGRKHLAWIETTCHIDLYDQPEYVNQAIDELDAFFAEELVTG